jgi:hypothetical protein
MSDRFVITGVLFHDWGKFLSVGKNEVVEEVANKHGIALSEDLGQYLYNTDILPQSYWGHYQGEKTDIDIRWIDRLVTLPYADLEVDGVVTEIRVLEKGPGFLSVRVQVKSGDSGWNCVLHYSGSYTVMGYEPIEEEQ